LRDKAHFRNLTLYNVTNAVITIPHKNDFAKVSENVGR